MSNWCNRNLSLTDSIVRYVLGSAIILAVLMLLVQAWVSILSIYLINTAILRWDPMYYMLRKFRKAMGVKVVEPVMPEGKPLTH
jgi:hypothetical protein